MGPFKGEEEDVGDNLSIGRRGESQTIMWRLEALKHYFKWRGSKYALPYMGFNTIHVPVDVDTLLNKTIPAADI